MKTKVEIIKETAEFYNSGNRGYDVNNGTCEYLTSEGNRCAVGRCIQDDLVASVQQAAKATVVCQETWPKFEGKFKPEYEGHGPSFWEILQMFHDNMNNWDETGLTERGRLRYDQLIKEFENK